MNKHQELYKNKPMGFVNLKQGRLVRTVKLEEHRRANRNVNYSTRRDGLETSDKKEISSLPSEKEIRYQRWKAERDFRKKIESQKKKPVFKVGVVHHKFYSPVHDKVDVKHVPCHGKNVKKEKYEPTPPKRVTRATQKRLAAKMANNNVTSAIPSTSTLQSNATKSKVKSAQTKLGSSFAPANYSFNPPEGLSKVPLFGKFAIPKKTEENNEEKPWPRASNPLVDIMSPQKMRNSFVRQNLQERFSSDSLDMMNCKNMSTEAAKSRLTSEDESPEEIATLESAESKNSAIQNPTTPEKTAESKNFDEIMKLETPPRSGSPIPASFSPYIVSSRSKDNARKEQQLKIRRSLSGSNIPTKDTVMKNLNISVEEEEQTAQYFRCILESTIASFKELCNKWEEIRQEPNLSEDARYQINQAIGQTNLLMKKKFERCRGLILDCETGKGEMFVTCKDLQGFWDVVYIEVENCRSRFLKLEALRSRDWVEEQITVPNKRVTRKKTDVPKPKIVAKGSARSWILAARKKMMQPEESNDINVDSTEDKEGEKKMSTTLKDRNSRQSLTDTPTPQIQSRRQSTPKATPRKTPVSLRKIAQISQAAKTIRSPLAIMKISKLTKNPQVTLDNTVSSINSDQTSAKGILKKLQNSTVSESQSSKSARIVDFYNDVFLDEVEEEDDYGTFDCSFMNNVTVRKVEKRLDFEDESFIEIENTDTDGAIIAATPDEIPPLNTEMSEPAAAHVIPSIPNIVIVPSTPIQTASNINRTSQNWSELYDMSIQEEVPEEISVSTRVLRNRTVAATTPKKSTSRRSIKSPPKDEQLLNSSTKENCDPLRGRTDSTNSDTFGVFKESGTSEGQTKLRRSARKSIRSAVIPSIPNIVIVPSTPIQTASNINRTSQNWSELYDMSIQEEVPEEISVSTRVLRNRTVAATTPKTSTSPRSIKSPPKDEQLLNSSTKENCDPLRGRTDSTNSDTFGILKESGTSEGQMKLRRSARKSIRLTADERTTSTPKPVTSHSKQSKKVSVSRVNSRKSVGGLLEENLICFDSPL